MYLDFFSLKKFPFRITPDPSMFFPGGANGPGVVLNALVYAVTSGEGIVKVVGEVGSGKTMLCRMLEERLPDSVEIVYIANPSLSARDIIYAIAFELDLDVDASTERLMVMHKLQDYLLKKHSEGGTVVVFIEEAQGMPIETLEEIRLLSNLETHRHKLMQIILFGQPELDKNLQGKNIRQLRERITHSFYLEPMNQEQTSDYLQYRMQAAGCPWPQVFTTKAEKLLNKASEGLTRRVNILADKALMAAYASSSIQPGHQYGAVQQKVLPQHVKAAIKDSGYGLRHLMPWTAIFSSLAVVVIAAAVYIGIDTDSAEQIIISSPMAETASESTPAVAAVSVPVQEENESDMTVELPQSADAVEAAVEVVEAEPVFVQEESVPEQTIPEEIVVEVVEEARPEESAAPEMAVLEMEPEYAEEFTDDAKAALTNMEVSESTDTLIHEELEESMEQSIEIVEAEPAIASPMNEDAEPAITLREASSFEGVTGLIGVRARSSSEWLENIASKNSYTVQMASFPLADEPLLEEYLQLLALTELLNETYLCLISRTASRPQQWLVIHGDFSGVSRARQYIDSLPAYSRQYEPFVRNSNSIACLSGMPESA
jgi:type II secretory pathway predicted ATPase ExeA